jgi:hypothetical protein
VTRNRRTFQLAFAAKLFTPGLAAAALVAALAGSSLRVASAQPFPTTPVAVTGQPAPGTGALRALWRGVAQAGTIARCPRGHQAGPQDVG